MNKQILNGKLINISRKIFKVCVTSSVFFVLSGDTLLHKSAREGHQSAALFLVQNKANGNITNKKVMISIFLL